MTVVLANGTTKTVNVLTVGASNVNAFVGVGDPDSNHDGMFNQNDDPARERRDRPRDHRPRLRPGAVQAGRDRRPPPATTRSRRAPTASRWSACRGSCIARQQPECRRQRRERADHGRRQPRPRRRRRSSTSQAAGSSFGSSGFTVGTGGGNSVVLDMRHPHHRCLRQRQHRPRLQHRRHPGNQPLQLHLLRAVDPRERRADHQDRADQSLVRARRSGRPGVRAERPRPACS